MDNYTIGYGFAFACWKIATFGPIRPRGKAGKDGHNKYCSTCWRLFRQLQERGQ